MIPVGVTFRDPMKIGPYRVALESVGLDVVEITPEAPRGLEELQGLLVTGGTDVGPHQYNEESARETAPADADRDALERALITMALTADIPILGTCRGMQMLNIVLGGRLIQHLATTATHRPAQIENKAAVVHPVEVVPKTGLESIFSAGSRPVNSRHHQAVAPDHLGEGLIITAVAPDGVVEAVELPSARFVVGVQWHPEDCLDRDVALFTAFAAALR